MTKKELAASLHAKGYNCAQAVACAFAEEAGVSDELLFKASEGFGGGMGTGDGVCGAVSALILLAGLKNSGGKENPVTKRETYKISAELIRKFEEKNGSYICNQLKGAGTGKVLRSCGGCIDDCVELAEKLFREGK